MSKDLNEVLNYMKQYVEDKYKHDSEPMLNYKDLQLVLEEIERLKEEYVMLQNASDEVEEEKDKEIERLHSIIKEVRQDLINTKNLNKHIKDKYNNEYIYIDIDHIEYLIKALDKESKQ